MQTLFAYRCNFIYFSSLVPLKYERLDQNVCTGIVQYSTYNYVNTAANNLHMALLTQEMAQHRCLRSPNSSLLKH